MLPDKNKFIRLFLISAGFLIYFYFFRPKTQIQPTAPPSIPATGQSTSGVDLTNPAPLLTGSSFAHLLEGQEKYTVVENELLKVVLSTKGGTIKKVSLKKYKDTNGQPLVLLDEQSSSMGLVLPYDNLFIDTKDLYFDKYDVSTHQIQDTQVTKATFRLMLNPAQYLEQSFQFADGYQIDYYWRAVGMESSFNHPTIATSFCWKMDMRRLEADHKADASRSTVNYYLLDHTFDKLKESSTELEKKQLRVPIKWVSIKQRFFSSAVIAQDSFTSGDLSMAPITTSSNVNKSIHLSLPLSGESRAKSSGGLTFFFGPNDYKTLQKVTKGFEQNIPLGWAIVKWVNKGLIMPLFAFLEKYFSNYGLIIFLLVISIKLLLAPLSYKSFIAMAKMQLLKPQLDEIKERYKQDPQKAQMEQVAFYRELGINPLSGCMPILLQMPILLAMFNFFPHAIALRQASFLWAHDLSTYDSIIQLPFTIPVYGNHVSLFTLLMVLSTILYTRASNQSGPKEGPMKGLTYIMPVAFMFVLNTFPAGLSFYYCISNVMTFIQQKLISYWVNTDSLKKQLMNKQKKEKQASKLPFKSRVFAAIEAHNKKKK